MSDDPKDYKVGYGKPPKHGQFQKGQSGNPKGRSKGAKGFAACLSRELERKITVREGDRIIRITKAEAAAKRVVELALKGEKNALQMIPRLQEKACEWADRDIADTAPDETDEAILQHFAALLAQGFPLPGVSMTNAGPDEESGHDEA